MKLSDVKEFINNLPEEFDSFGVVNGELGFLKDSDENYYYRLDKPILSMVVDEETEEIAFLHQTKEEIEKIENNDHKT